MYKECEWISEPIKIPDNIYTEEVEEALYKIFRDEIYDVDWYYKGKKVNMRRHPMYREKEEIFFHIISGKNNPMIDDCQTDIDRVARLRWGKEIIEHEPCKNEGTCCKGILFWEYKDNNTNRTRTKLFHCKLNYLVILEERSDYWLYITSYRVSGTPRRREELKQAHDYINKKRLAT